MDGSSRKVTAANVITKAHGLSDGLVKVASSTMAAATAGTDYTTPTGTENLQNKTLDNTNVITIKDANLQLQDDADTTKQAKFQLSDITAGQNRTITLPDASDTLVGKATTDILTNKTITNSNNTLGAVTMGLGSDADGDMYYRSSSVLTRLPKGSASQYLQMNAGATAPAWVTLTAGNVNVDYIVAASGGTHTTLGAALAAASSGETIFVKSGTYTEITRSITTTNLTIIGESAESTIIDTSNVAYTLSGAGLKMFNVQWSNSAATTTFSGNDQNFVGCVFKTSHTSTAYTFGGAQKTVTGCRFESTGTTTLRSWQLTGTYQTYAGNTFEVNGSSGNATIGSIHIDGASITFTGNQIYLTDANNDFDPLLSLGTNGNYYSITGNSIVQAGGTHYAIFARNVGSGLVISGNTINIGAGAGIYIDGGTTDWLVTGNRVNISTTNASSYGVYIDATRGVFSSNYVTNGSLSRIGVSVAGTRDNININGNTIYNFATGIEIQASTSDACTIVGNDLSGNTTPIADSGTATTIKSNTGVSPLFEKEFMYMKNTSGSTINAGNLVVYKSVAAGNEVTTSTTGGDNKVFGVASAAISNNASGYIQTLGKTTILTADGTTDIAVGDFLTHFTTAGIAKKAAAADTAIAIALEAFTTDASTGVLDALIIKPRLI